MVRSDLTRVVEAAVLAPSIHNTQPWLFRIVGDTIEVYADHRRQLHVTDPDGKALRVSGGAAIFNARLAFAHLGYEVDTVVLPQPLVPDLLARITTIGTCLPTPVQEQLFDAIARRHSHRQPFESTDVAVAAQARLIDAARTEGAWLDYVVAFEAWYLISELVRTADQILSQDIAYRNELASWVRDGDSPDGVPRHLGGPAPAPTDVLARRDFGGPAQESGRSPEPHPLVAVLGAFGDRPVDDITAGQALQRVLLTATVNGLATSMLSQPVDVPHLREQLRLGLYRPGQPQMVLRIGYGTHGHSPPRRPVTDVLLTGPEHSDL